MAQDITEQQNDANGPPPLPSAMLRQWHPNLLPDSEVVVESPLARSLLDYHLETITSRKQEQAFEEFCRRLVQKEVCPNLKPQTGPTGGGDSRVDASSHPMAPVLANRYYWANPKPPPSTEAWGFAFSAMKKWKSKIESDAKKIKALDRKFEVVFFVTNQLVRDKTRADLEKKLTKDHGFEAHILDRTWLLNNVIDKANEEIAIDTLGIQGVSKKRTVLGQKDAQRTKELEESRKRIEQLTSIPAPG